MKSAICIYHCNLQSNLVEQWIQMYESQRRRNLVVNDERELSNEENEILIETVNEEMDSDSRNDKITSNSIEIVEYVSTTFN